MIEITLPEDTSTEDNVRTLLYLREVGAQASDMVEEGLRSILQTARNRVAEHAAYQAIFKADRYTRILCQTIYQRWGYLDRYTVNGDTVTLYCIDSRGEGAEDYTIPLAWLWIPSSELVATMDAQISAYVAKHDEAKRIAVAKREIGEKAQLAALLERYGKPAP